ncbi:MULTISPECIES: hypothetical protein [Tenacibaculum]|uniref:hypothetical protein n=1 Tax=Tenacibaculum TaxID=104267 RepID=UPI000A4CF5BF|nr:hypothetical protein [Tenacibaculum mesophilum]BFF37940.1 hypothetical protein BACT7_28020 [Tenacibaculum mesophilum]BFF41345.1 hypothetical protein BACY1_31500 [Tenacibaculum mesophilum]
MSNDFGVKTLSKEGLKDINGGGFISSLKGAAFFAGYFLGRNIDSLHGIYDGITGGDKH